MVAIAPRVTTIMNGKPSQTLVATLAAKAVENRENHEMGSTLVPNHSHTVAIAALTAPNCRWNIPRQAIAVT